MYITQSLKRNVQLYPNKTATAYMNRTYTWKQSFDRITKVAASIRKLDINEGDRGAILSHNSDRYFEFFYSVSWAGAVFVPINTRLAPPEIEFWINDSESKVIFVDSNFSKTIESLIKDNKIKSIKKVVYMSDDACPESMIKYEDLISDTTGSLKVIINFLNKFMNIEENEKKFLNAVNSCEFNTLANKEKREGFHESVSSKKNNENLNFFYLGKKNNWKNLLDPKIEEKIRLVFSKEMKELNYI